MPEAESQDSFKKSRGLRGYEEARAQHILATRNLIVQQVTQQRNFNPTGQFSGHMCGLSARRVLLLLLLIG